MGSFKLGSNRRDVLKENGFLNKSPFTSSGNTMAYANGDTDPPKKSLQQQADDNAGEAEKVLLKPGDKGYDPSKKASYVQKGSATKETPFTEEGNKSYANLSQEEKDAQDKKWKEIQNKKAEIFSYEDKSVEKKPTKKKTITTTETPRKRKTQDYITGEGDKVFAPPQTQRFMNLSKALTGKADSFGFKNVKGKQLKQAQDAYDKKVLDSRAKQGPMGAESLTLAEQKAKKNINKIGAGTSEIVDTKSGEGLRKGEIAVKDGEGNMMYVNRKKGTSRPASPENDINPEKTTNKANATTLSGRETVVTASKV